MREKPSWADDRPWEKYPSDVRASVKIIGAGVHIDIKDVIPELAHQQLLTTYMNTDDEDLREAVNQTARLEGFSGMGHRGIDVGCSYYRPRLHLDQKHTCPKRMFDFGPQPRIESVDSWDKVGDWRCCTYCGSMHPDDVVEVVKKLGPSIISTTDKSYKRYIHLPNTPNASFGPIKFYVEHFSEAQVFAFNALFKPSASVPVSGS